jgi:prefoldin subunit 5
MGINEYVTQLQKEIETLKNKLAWYETYYFALETPKEVVLEYKKGSESSGLVKIQSNYFILLKIVPANYNVEDDNGTVIDHSDFPPLKCLVREISTVEK